MGVHDVFIVGCKVDWIIILVRVQQIDMIKKVVVVGEVDVYCIKCKLDLGYCIVVMVGDTIKKVECFMCGGEYFYRVFKLFIKLFKIKVIGRKWGSIKVVSMVVAVVCAVVEFHKSWE